MLNASDVDVEKEKRGGLTILVFISLHFTLFFINKDSVTGDDLPIDLSYFSLNMDSTSHLAWFSSQSLRTIRQDVALTEPVSRSPSRLGSCKAPSYLRVNSTSSSTKSHQMHLNFASTSHPNLTHSQSATSHMQTTYPLSHTRIHPTSYTTPT